MQPIGTMADRFLSKQWRIMRVHELTCTYSGLPLVEQKAFTFLASIANRFLLRSAISGPE